MKIYLRNWAILSFVAIMLGMARGAPAAGVTAALIAFPFVMAIGAVKVLRASGSRRAG